jgi:hypothetical protein
MTRGFTVSRWTGVAAAVLGSASLVLAVQSAVAVPEPRAFEHMLFDDRLGTLVFVESSRKAGVQRLWRMEHARWALVDGSGPSVRELHAAAYDPVRRRLVMHGGMVADGGDTMLGDLWEFDGTRWSRPESQGPGHRDHHTMVFDPDRRRMVLFGGRVTKDRLGSDTWEYDGVSWRRFDVSGPGGRAHFPMAYDTVRKRVLLFGGMDERYTANSDLWAWDGRTWERLSAGGPPGRTHHRMAFDRRHGTLVLFGGQRGTTAFGDTWVWNGSAWSGIPTPADGPAKRGGHVMAWDPAREQVVMFGGGFYDGKVSHHHDDLWAWNGRAWVRLR